MSITVKTDVKVREETNSDLQADAMCTMILLNDIKKNMSDKRKELLEEGTLPLPTTLAVIGGVPVMTTSASSVDETKEEQTLEEEDLNDITYAEAMIAAMSAMSVNLSHTIDMSSERSVLLKKLCDSSIKMAQQNIEDNIQDIKDARREERKARRAERRGMFFSRAIAGLSIAAGACMCATGVGAVAGGMLIATSAGMLIADETGGTEDAIKGISKGLVMAGMNETDAAIVGSVSFAVGTMVVGGGATALASKAATVTARGAGAARMGFEAAGEAAGRAASIGSKAVLEGADLSDAAINVAKAAKEAGKGATMAAEGATEVATAARTAAKNAADAAAKATSPAQKATLLKVADEATAAANKAQDAAAIATRAAKSANDSLGEARNVVAAFKNGTASKTDLIASMQKSIKAADDAKVCAEGATLAAESADKVNSIARLAMTGEKGAEMADNALNIEKGLPPKYNTGVDLEIQTALNSSFTRRTFGNLSTMMGPANAAKVIHGVAKMDVLTNLIKTTFAFTLIEAAFMTSAGVYKLKASEYKADAAETQEEKTLIMATSEAIDDQSARESEFLAMMQDALSKAIGGLKPQLAKQWRTTTNAIQG